jgi:hypothetical protein
MLFVEGQGDEIAVPVLVARLLTEYDAWDAFFLHEPVVRTKGASKLLGRKAVAEQWWEKWLRFALKYRDLAAVLLVVDGDLEEVGNGQPFCPGQCALGLSTRARSVGAGAEFSVASVFARQEYESWLIAGVASLAGRNAGGGLAGVAEGAVSPDGDLEVAPRGAKEWLSKHMARGYREALHQASLTRLVDISLIRERNMRSFRRLEVSLKALVNAARTGQHVVLP